MRSARVAAELPIPEFYDPMNAERWGYVPDQHALLERAVAWRKGHALEPAARDALRIHLILVDLQKDFCFPEGSLYVGGRSGRGALEDNDRIARFIYRNLGALTEITCTLDSHHPYQIFSPAFWLDEEGNAPAPHQEVTLADLRAGRFRPNPAVAHWVTDRDEAWLQRQVEYYCEQLEKTGHYKLYLWPPHCIVGSEGHTLAGVIHEARLFHAYARVSPAPIMIKGELPLTEYYSAIRPEVMTTFDGRTIAHPNTAFLEALAGADAVILAGQAASHCVRTTANDLLTFLDEASRRKLYLLRDCMTPIAVPEPGKPGSFIFDFTPQTDAALQRFAEAGMNIVESTTPIAEWPGLGG